MLPAVDGIPGAKVAGVIMAQVRFLCARMNDRGGRRTAVPDARGTMTAIHRQLVAGVHPADILYKIETGFYACPSVKLVSAALGWAQGHVAGLDPGWRVESRKAWHRWWREYVADRRDPMRWRERISRIRAVKAFPAGACRACGIVGVALDEGYCRGCS